MTKRNAVRRRGRPFRCEIKISFFFWCEERKHGTDTASAPALDFIIQPFATTRTRSKG